MQDGDTVAQDNSIAIPGLDANFINGKWVPDPEWVKQKMREDAKKQNSKKR